jgi:transposase
VSSTRDQVENGTSPQRDEEFDRLQKEVEQLRVLLGSATARIQKLETELGYAREQVAWFHRQLFGQKAERVQTEDLEAAWVAFVNEQEARSRQLPTDPVVTTELRSVQLLLDLSLLEPSPAPAPPPQPSTEPAAPGGSPPPAPPGPTRSRHGRAPVPPTLREETITLTPEPNELPDGSRLIDAEVSYRVGVRPAELIRIAVVRPRFAVDNEDETTRVITAEPPREMIERGLFAPSGLAHIIASKWDRHVPYNRLTRYFAEQGYRLPVSTLSGVGIRAAPLAAMLVETMEHHARTVAPYLAIDATGVLMQRPDACLRGHIWIRYIEATCVLVSFTQTHDSDTAGAQLDGWACPTLADGAMVYDRSLRMSGNPRGGCWSHGRRNLIYAAPTDGRALIGIKLVNDLFAIEQDLLGLTPADRLAERLCRSQPVVDTLFQWRDDVLANGNLGRSLLAKALRYLRNQEERLTYFLRDGAVPIHNNETELRARHVAVGRKNWLFFGSPAGAAAGATWLSLVLSARMHHVPVEPYLRDLFRVLPDWPHHRLIELAPHRWIATRSRLNPNEMRDELGPLTIPPPLPP